MVNFGSSGSTSTQTGQRTSQRPQTQQASNTTSQGGSRTTQSSIDQPAGTLSRTSAETGERFESVAQRKSVESFRAGEQTRTGTIRAQQTEARLQAEAQAKFNAIRPIKTTGSGVYNLSGAKEVGGMIRPIQTDVFGFNKTVDYNPFIPQPRGVEIPEPYQRQPPELQNAQITEPKKSKFRRVIDAVSNENVNRILDEKLFTKDSGMSNPFTAYAGLSPKRQLAIDLLLLGGGNPLGAIKRGVQVVKSIPTIIKETPAIIKAGVKATPTVIKKALTPQTYADIFGLGVKATVKEAPRVAKTLTKAEAVNVFEKAGMKIGTTSGKAIIKSAELINAEAKNPLVRFGKALTLGTTQTYLGSRAVVSTAKVRTSPEDVALFQEVQRTMGYKEIFEKDATGQVVGFLPEDKLMQKENVSGLKIMGRKILEPSDISLFFSNREEIKRRTENILRLQGLSEDQIQKRTSNVLKARQTLAFGEIPLYINAERISEKYGGLGIRTAFKSFTNFGRTYTAKEVPKEIAKRTVGTFIGGGILEAEASQLSSDLTRGNKITAFNLLVAGGTGAIISPIFGVPTASLSATRPAVSKFFASVGNILDIPYETIGDITQEAIQRAGRRITGKPILRPAIVRTGNRYMFSEVAENVKPFKVRVPSFANVFGFGTSTKQQTQTQTNLQARSRNYNNFFNNLFNFNIEKPTKQQQIQEDVIPIKEIEKVSERTEQPLPVQEKQQTTITEPSFSLNVPVVTPVYPFKGLLPPLPPLPLGKGLGTGLAKDRLKFVNETVEAQKVFFSQLGLGVERILKGKRARGRK